MAVLPFLLGGILALATIAFLTRHNRIEPIDHLTDAQRVDLMERECRIGPYADLPDGAEHLVDSGGWVAPTTTGPPRPRLPDPGRYADRRAY